MSINLELYKQKIIEDFQDNVNFKWEVDVTVDEYFSNWFLQNSKLFIRSPQEEVIFPSLKIKQHTNSQCFHNSQLLAIDNSIKYYEGLVFGVKYKMSFHHGFNVIEDVAIDLTDYCNKVFKSSIDDNWHKESEILYFGVHIPNEFLRNYPEILENSNIHKPIIFEYYSYLSKK